ncbi:hypothetical protein Hamer_G008836, partial [Homarus americanus]
QQQGIAGAGLAATTAPGGGGGELGAAVWRLGRACQHVVEHSQLAPAYHCRPQCQAGASECLWCKDPDSTLPPSYLGTNGTPGRVRVLAYVSKQVNDRATTGKTPPPVRCDSIPECVVVNSLIRQVPWPASRGGRPLLAAERMPYRGDRHEDRPKFTTDINYVKKMPGTIIFVQLVCMGLGFLLALGGSMVWKVKSGHAFFTFVSFMSFLSCICWLLVHVLQLFSLFKTPINWNIV